MMNANRKRVGGSMLKRQKYMDNIISKMAIFTATIQMSAMTNRMDTLVAAEDLICGLLNRMYGFNLVNVNQTQMVYPGVDLFDTENRVAVQVTADSSSMKVRATLGRFQESNLQEVFPRLFIVQLTNSKFPNQRRFMNESKELNIELRILNITDLLNEIEALSTEDQAAISDYLDREIDSAVATEKTPGTDAPGEPLVSTDISPFVFVSYSHLDSERVQSIVEAMGQKGMCVWWDQDIEPGTPWDETIGNHLFDCKCVVALVTKNFMDSEVCLDEIYVAKMKNKLLMVYLEELELPPKMYRYMRIQDIRFPAGTTDDDICDRLSKTELLKDCYIQ